MIQDDVQCLRLLTVFFLSLLISYYFGENTRNSFVECFPVIETSNPKITIFTLFAIETFLVFRQTILWSLLQYPEFVRCSRL